MLGVENIKGSNCNEPKKFLAVQMARKKIKEFELKSIKLNQIKQFMPLDWLGTSIKEAHLVSSTKTFPSK